ncbi:MAG: TRAP transporter large permease [Hyphomicrobiaceae bacterium]
MTTAFLAFCFFFAIGIPIGATLGLVGISYYFFTGAPIEAAAYTMLNAVKSYSLISVPLYLMAGQIMNVSGVSNRLFDFAEALVGRFRGGMAQVNVVNSILFSGLSGSAVADAGGIGAVEIAAMRRHGYPDWMVLGVTAASSIIAPIIPPSIVLVIYGSIADVSIGALFLAGVLPGLLVGGTLMVGCYIMSFHPSVPKFEKRHTCAEVRSTAWRALLPMLTPVIILGGIFSGWYTPTEGAAIAVVYAMALWIFLDRTFTMREFVTISAGVVKATGSVLFIAATASLVGVIATESGLAKTSLEWFKSITDDKTVLLLLISLFLLVIGMFLDTISAYFLVTPVLLPILKVYDVDLVHFGIIITVTLMIGVLTPPVGQVLFVLSSITGISLERLAVYVFPFLIPLLVVLLLIVLFPQISLWLPRLVLG